MSGPPRHWTEERIVAAVRAWADVHGEPPRESDWIRATPQTPSVTTMRTRFGSFNAAIRAASLVPRTLTTPVWTRRRIVTAAKAWKLRHGRSPRPTDWSPAGDDYPHAGTVYNQFGSWAEMLKAAGLGSAEVRMWTRELIAEAMLDELGATGEWPTCDAWKRGARGRMRPVTTTVKKTFGSWSAALLYAGFDPAMASGRRRRHFAALVAEASVAA